MTLTPVVSPDDVAFPFRSPSNVCPETPPPFGNDVSNALSPVVNLWNKFVTRLSPKKKRPRLTQTSPGVERPSLFFLHCPTPSPEQHYHVSIEEIEDPEAPSRVEVTEWNGVRSFWWNTWEESEETEFFDDENEEDEDQTPIEEIMDPEGENWETDDTVEQEGAFTNQQHGKFVFPPTCEEAQAAYKELTSLLFPRRRKGRGYRKCTIEAHTRTRLEHIRSFLHIYVTIEKAHPGIRGNWNTAARNAALYTCRAQNYAKLLKRWARDFIDDSKELPRRNHGGGKASVIDDEDVAQDIKLHLQGIGKYMKAEDIVRYCGTPEMLERLGRTKTISVATARRWLIKMGYRWTKNPKGQYVDGHEREDVVKYRCEVFLPAMMEYRGRMRRWLENSGWDVPPEITRIVIVWFHDESTFYAHNWRQNCWMPPGSSPTPYAKGEGVSLMIAHFVSACYG